MGRVNTFDSGLDYIDDLASTHFALVAESVSAMYYYHEGHDRISVPISPLGYCTLHLLFFHRLNSAAKLPYFLRRRRLHDVI